MLTKRIEKGTNLKNKRKKMKGWFLWKTFFEILQQKRIKFTSLIKKVKNNETSYLLHLKFGGTSTYKTQTAIPTFIY